MKRPTDSNTLTPEQFLCALAALGWKQTDFARKTGVTAGAVNRWATGQAPAPLWATAYLGAMQDLAMLHAKYLAPTKDTVPQRLAHVLDEDLPRSPGAD
ncbi:helix-turn-helix transcriptional regulator [Rhodoferax sp.]|uniref:helix-turn-helix domain-containing protein n=1 Tax=Rhodoferax sp. TaxID=50421 RepID=UPI0026313E82|nr:helix-turn-helix transcriptional regulator [Rhodoferax sp.]MDD2920236.1 helix-turn-helix transcriptional regulator [Rhodoferax sp.]